MELFVSDTGGRTILVTHTSGLSRIAASGENWTPTEGVTTAFEEPA